MQQVKKEADSRRKAEARVEESVNASELNVAFQMDGNGNNTPYSAWLDKVNFSVW